MFAVEVLKHLSRACFDIALVVTQPDRKAGRHLQTAPTPVKTYALEHHVQVFQPEDVNAASAVSELMNVHPDIFLVVSYGRILSKAVLDIPAVMSINIHSSLLPKFRGAAPVNWALIRNEKKTGVTFIKMNEAMDEGDILAQKPVSIDVSDHARSLDEKLAKIAADMVNGVLEGVCHKRIKPRKQDHQKASTAPLICKKHGRIEWEKKAQEIYNNFRGCFGWPGSYTICHGKLLKILDMKIGKGLPKVRPGTVLKAQGNELEIACGQGSIIVSEVLPESHKKMPVSSFLAGHSVKQGDVLGGEG